MQTFWLSIINIVNVNEKKKVVSNKFIRRIIFSAEIDRLERINYQKSPKLKKFEKKYFLTEFLICLFLAGLRLSGNNGLHRIYLSPWFFFQSTIFLSSKRPEAKDKYLLWVEWISVGYFSCLVRFSFNSINMSCDWFWKDIKIYKFLKFFWWRTEACDSFEVFERKKKYENIKIDKLNQYLNIKTSTVYFAERHQHQFSYCFKSYFQGL